MNGPVHGVGLFDFYSSYSFDHMTEETFTPHDSLRIIQQMIDKTKQNISDKSIFYLVWGWITFVACTGQFLLKHVINYEKHYLVWWLVVPGAIFSAWQGARQRKMQRVKTYVDESLTWLWVGMGIAYFVLSMILTQYGWDKIVFPFFIMLYGLGTFVSGSIVRFTPFVVGGLLAFALAIGSAFASYDYQILFAAGAILVSYIVPAYMLRRKNKQLNR
jgi:hypothetical protein